MSFSYEKLTPVLIEDPVTQVGDVAAYAVLQGGNKISFKTFTSTNIAASSISFSCPPPSTNVIVDRNILLTLPIRLTFSGTVTTSNAGYVPPTSLLNSGFDAPRAIQFLLVLNHCK